MRPAANFTLHAILAACLAALAASSAAAGPRIDNEGHAWLSFELMGGARSQGGQLEVQSYHWGPRQTTSADGSRTRAGNQVILDDTPGGAAAKERQAGMKELATEPDKSDAGGAPGPESERRKYAPVKFATPHDRGSLTFQGSMPGCEAGKRYAGAQFAGGGMQYQLEDVVIADCVAGGATLNYAKVKVRGWDPEK